MRGGFLCSSPPHPLPISASTATEAHGPICEQRTLPLHLFQPLAQPSSAPPHDTHRTSPSHPRTIGSRLQTHHLHLKWGRGLRNLIWAPLPKTLSWPISTHPDNGAPESHVLFPTPSPDVITTNTEARLVREGLQIPRSEATVN